MAQKYNRRWRLEKRKLSVIISYECYIIQIDVGNIYIDVGVEIDVRIRIRIGSDCDLGGIDPLLSILIIINN